MSFIFLWKNILLQKVRDIVFIASNFLAYSSRNRYCEMMLTSHRGRHIQRNRHSRISVDGGAMQIPGWFPVSVTTDNFIRKLIMEMETVSIGIT